MNLHDCDIYVKYRLNQHTHGIQEMESNVHKMESNVTYLFYSEGWFKVRKQATVTGSSIYDTLGLDGLK